MVGLTISMYFQQFEDSEFLFFRGSMPPALQKTLAVSNRPDFSRDTSIPIFEEQLSQANERRNTFLLNYHKIRHKITKSLNLDIQANAKLQS